MEFAMRHFLIAFSVGALISVTPAFAKQNGFGSETDTSTSNTQGMHRILDPADGPAAELTVDGAPLAELLG
jgi:hypothetical protein